MDSASYLEFAVWAASGALLCSAAVYVGAKTTAALILCRDQKTREENLNATLGRSGRSTLRRN